MAFEKSHKRMCSPEELLTFAECERILCNAQTQKITKHGSDQSTAAAVMSVGAAVLKDYSLKPAKDAIGYLGDYYHLILSYETPQSDINNNVDGGAKHLHLFVKALTRRFAEPEMAAIFKKEVQLYDGLLKELQEFASVPLCPRSYYARDDLLVMEDLSIDGALKLSMSANEVRQLLRGLAALHAASVAYEAHKHVSLGAQYAEMLFEITVAPTVAWYTTGVKALLAVAVEHPNYQTMKMQEFIAMELPQRLELVYAMTSASSEYCNVLCHRDCWSGNVFFHSSDKDSTALLVDYQTSRYCPPAIDVLMALYMNMPLADVKQHEAEYLRFYYENFRANLQSHGIAADEHMKESELRQTFNEFRLFALVYKALAATILLVPTAYVTNEYKYTDRATLVLQHMRENENFCLHMHQCIDEVILHLTSNASEVPRCP